MHRILLGLLICVCSIAAANDQHPDSVAYRAGKWFQYVPYGHSLYADMHPDFMRCDLGAVSYAPETNYGGSPSKYGLQMFAVFGARINYWNMDLQNRRFGLSQSQTLSAHLWMDISEHTTSPVVNTDYRIAAPTFTFIHRLQGAETVPFLKNYSIMFCPFKHESTHIGDEMVLQRADKGYALRRVNVSYNYAELNLTLNEPENRYEQTHTFRMGAFVLLNPNHGWYFVDSRDGEVNNIASNHNVTNNSGGLPERYGPSGFPFEWWVQYQYQSNSSKHGFQAIVSAELRNRAMYGYSLTEKTTSHIPRESNADPRRFTYCVFVGVRYNMPQYDSYFSRIALGVRAYHGNCPYGMFRSVDNFSHIGFCVIAL
ncbi:MAG: hypothetical protein IKO26_10355 [Paludibacteraceae bacterium]|nr:hypothetical protein [Paludibacteraceae bacterium]